MRKHTNTNGKLHWEWRDEDTSKMCSDGEKKTKVEWINIGCVQSLFLFVFIRHFKIFICCPSAGAVGRLNISPVTLNNKMLVARVTGGEGVKHGQCSLSISGPFLIMIVFNLGSAVRNYFWHYGSYGNTIQDCLVMSDDQFRLRSDLSQSVMDNITPERGRLTILLMSV